MRARPCWVGSGNDERQPRIEYLLAKTLGALPPRLQVRLSGKPLISIDGDTLAADTQLTLALLQRRGEPPVESLSPQQARESRRRLSAVYAGPPEPVGSIEDLEIDAEVPLRARHYTPSEPGGELPLLVYFHGGGFLYGDLDTHDGVWRLLCAHAGVHVLAIDYRLALEHPFPAAVEDARAALRWAYSNAIQLDRARGKWRRRPPRTPIETRRSDRSMR